MVCAVCSPPKRGTSPTSPVIRLRRIALATRSWLLPMRGLAGNRASPVRSASADSHTEQAPPNLNTYVLGYLLVLWALYVTVGERA